MSDPRVATTEVSKPDKVSTSITKSSSEPPRIASSKQTEPPKPKAN